MPEDCAKNELSRKTNATAICVYCVYVSSYVIVSVCGSACVLATCNPSVFSYHLKYVGTTGL